MSISLKKYIDISSGVGGASGVQSRDLIGRYLTSSSVLLPGEIATFLSLNDVGLRFASNSPEYLAAADYFGFVSKLATGPQMLSMARWVKTATAPLISGITGVTGSSALTAIQAATSITFEVTDNVGTVTPVNITNINLTAASDFATVAADLQTAFRANANPQLTNCTVAYTAATGQFTFSGSLTGSGSVTVQAGSNPTTDVGKQIGWLASDGAIYTNGYAAQTPVQAIQTTTNQSDDFGAFGFLDSTTNPVTPLAQADIVAVAQWNHAQNNKFIYCVPCSIPQASVLEPLLIGFSGCALTVANNDFAEFEPMEILAATDYTRTNASQSYMFYQFANRQPTVTDTATSDSLDALRTNYNGQTMQAGSQITFYQRGVLMGSPSTAAVDMNTYANEMWLKDNIATAILAAFLALPRIPANDTGRGIILSNIQYSLDQALDNGTISVGKVLSALQKSFITQVSGDPKAWQTVQTAGYWIDVVISSYVTSDQRTEYKATYVLIYSKDDVVRKVIGSDILI